MKKKLFFLLLFIVICVIWFLFFDESRFLCALSFVPPFAIWVVIRVLYLAYERQPTSRSFFDLINADPEIDEFDRCLQKKEDVSQHESVYPCDLSDRKSIKSGTEMLEQNFEINKNKRCNLPEK